MFSYRTRREEVTMKARLSSHQIYPFLAVGLFLGWPALGRSQSIAATLPVSGRAIAINRTTDKVYVVGGLGPHSVVSVIDGKTQSITSLPAGPSPVAVAVDEATNKIYVANQGGLYGGEIFLGDGNITVIDGVTNATTTVVDPNAKFPCSLAVNSSTNKVYVRNWGSANVTVIDGGTNSTATVTDPNAPQPQECSGAVAVNPTTNRIYVANGGSSGPGNISVINGATNSTTTVSDPSAADPIAIAINPVTNRVYVANNGDLGANHGNVTVIDGNTNAITTITDPRASLPYSIAVDSVTNKVYVTNAGSENVTVIDGMTNSTITVTDPNASPLAGLSALRPVAVAVNETTHAVYVANGGCDDVYQCATGSGQGSVTVIDGRTNSLTTIINPSGTNPEAVAVNPLTDEIYVANTMSGNLTIIDGGGSATAHTIAAVLRGSGSGTVASTPSGVDCGISACAASFAVGTPVSLNASAASGSNFVGWSGPCGGAGACVVDADQDHFVTATFNSTAPVQVAVPNVVGQTQAAATTAITGAGLSVGVVSQQSSSTVASGSVISESPAAGTNVSSGSAVNLVVSMGSSSDGGDGGHGGGGAIDWLTLGALLGALMAALHSPRRIGAIL
jgi:DNA-binding beta-propeller fold protein YncE